MSDEAHALERLISRYLDGECSPAERRELELRISKDPQTAALFDEYAALDRQFQTVLRETVLRPSTATQPVRLGERLARIGILAVAACLAVLFWFSPPNRVATNGPTEAATRPHSWFAAPPIAGDVLVERPAFGNRPVNWLGRPRTDWVVVPTEDPSEFLLIQMKSVETKILRASYDY